MPKNKKKELSHFVSLPIKTRVLRSKNAMILASEAKARENEALIIAELEKNPDLLPQDLFKINRIPPPQNIRIIRRLAAGGHPVALKYVESMRNRKETAQDKKDRVQQYFLENPGDTLGNCSRALFLSRHTVKQIVNHINKTQPGLINAKRGLLPAFERSQKKAEMVAVLMKDPTTCIRDLAKQIKLPIAITKNMYTEICQEYEDRYTEQLSMVRQYCASELIDSITALNAHATSDKKYMTRSKEVSIQAVKVLMKVYNIGSPDVNVSLGVTINQGQRDAAAEAAMQHVQYCNDLKLPDFSANEHIIDVTPKDEADDGE